MAHRSGRQRSHAIAGVFVFLLLGVFAVFSTMLVLVGAQAYRATATHSEEHNAQRSIYTYLLNSIRGDDSLGMLEVENEGGIDVLAVHYDFESGSYVKRIYCWDGSLREQLSSVKYEFDPAKGDAIAPADNFYAHMADGLLTIELTDAYGRAHTVQAVMRTER